MGVRWYLFVALVCIFDGDVEHLFMHVAYLYIPSLSGTCSFKVQLKHS